MLRIYFLQVWFNLSDPGVEDALYDSAAMRGFVDIDRGREPVPGETTICKFHHLIEGNGLGEKLFEAVNKHLSAKGIKIGTGTIMGATGSDCRHSGYALTPSVQLRRILIPIDALSS